MALSDLKQRLSKDRRTAQLHTKVRPEVMAKLRALTNKYDIPQYEIISELIMEAK